MWFASYSYEPLFKVCNRAYNQSFFHYVTLLACDLSVIQYVIRPFSGLWLAYDPAFDLLPSDNLLPIFLFIFCQIYNYPTSNSRVIWPVSYLFRASYSI